MLWLILGVWQILRWSSGVVYGVPVTKVFVARKWWGDDGGCIFSRLWRLVLLVRV